MRIVARDGVTAVVKTRSSYMQRYIKYIFRIFTFDRRTADTVEQGVRLQIHRGPGIETCQGYI